MMNMLVSIFCVLHQQLILKQDLLYDLINKEWPEKPFPPPEGLV